MAATPTLVHPARTGLAVTEHDLRVRAAGFEIELDDEGTPVVSARKRVKRFSLRGDPHDVAAASLRGLVVDRQAFVAAGGLDIVDDEDVAGVDLCARLRLHGGRVVHVPGAALFDDRPVRSRAALHRPVDDTNSAWQTLIDRRGAGDRRARRGHARTRRGGGSSRRPRRRRRWRRAGATGTLPKDWPTRCDVSAKRSTSRPHDRADSLAARSADVHLVLRGLAPVRRTSGQRHVLWVISHPESLAVEDCDAADLVLVASTRFAEHLRRQHVDTGRGVPAGDRSRAFPARSDRAPAHRHPVTVVAQDTRRDAPDRPRRARRRDSTGDLRRRLARPRRPEPRRRRSRRQRRARRSCTGPPASC